MIDEMNKLVDNVYRQFILRDFLGKIVPGSVFLASVLLLFLSPERLVIASNDLSTWVWLLLLGISWACAFAIQSFGERIGLIRYWAGLSDEEAYCKMVEFNKTASASDKQIFERFVVIKEACGNLAVSLSASIMILIVGGLARASTAALSNISLTPAGAIKVVACVVGLLTAWFLWRMHITHVERQTKWVNTVVNARSESHSRGDTPASPSS
jgi:hypothetical protein